jgi:low temperature requirement protein LtrA
VLSAADTNPTVTRVTILVRTTVALLTGPGFDEAFEEARVWFAVPYVFVRFMGLSFLFPRALQWQQPRPILTFAGISGLSLAFVVLGAALPLPWRY